MDCAQTKSISHRPWCVDDAYALGWGPLMPHATVWAKAAQHHGCSDTSKKKAQDRVVQSRTEWYRVVQSGTE